MVINSLRGVTGINPGQTYSNKTLQNVEAGITFVCLIPILAMVNKKKKKK